MAGGREWIAAHDKCKRMVGRAIYKSLTRSQNGLLPAEGGDGGGGAMWHVD